MLEKLKKELQWRELLKNIINEESLKKIIDEKKSFYIGIDPTADSIHIGHFLSLILVKILTNFNLKPVIVLGGFTGMIGDPSGRNSERELIDSKIIQKNVLEIEKQIKKILTRMNVRDFLIFDNSIIYEKLSILDLFQKYGKFFNLNTMLSRESVKNRIENGISFTEFSYQVFQGIDFFYLFKNHNVNLQLGGSDQWGNIISGIELIKKISGFESVVSGITINLLTDENGNKIGKTQGLPMWLDKNKTSSYTLFQYFINQSDFIARKLLKQATLISKQEFKKIEQNHLKNPKLKIFQNVLAKEFITLIHSKDDYENAKIFSNILFKEEYKKIKIEDLDNLKFLPSILIEKSEENLMEILINKSNKVNSKREYRELLASKSIKVNGEIIFDEKYILKNQFLFNKLIFVNIGKKNKYLIWKK